MRVSVKVPVVPNIGTIGVGIAKAGADMITLSGFEGGTGAARSHALRHVGLPSDIGTRAVHLALMEAGIRNRVEIWADGGYRHAHDIVKLHCLGANRVGFGTLAMVSLGCTICRGCQLDTCHVGIATQIEDKEEAELKGLKKFTPQEFESGGRELRALLPGDGRGGARAHRVARLRVGAGPGRAAPTCWCSRARSDSRGRARHDQAARGDARPRAARPAGGRRPARGPQPDLRAADPHEGEGGVGRSWLRWRTRSRPATWSSASGTRRRPTDADDRVLGTELAGAISRSRIAGTGPEATDDTLARLHFNGGSVGGQGLGAFNVYGVDITVEGGAQDGVAKTMLGGKVAVMKGKNRFGKRVNGSVGKSFAYGAQRGRLFVQGSADSRFCIRLSGADVVIGGEPQRAARDEDGCVADRANIKGFAFEYMTAGRAVVLGDPGPWFCAGQTGGRVYLRVNDEWNLDREALERRKGKGAKIALERPRRRGRARHPGATRPLRGRAARRPTRTRRPSGSWRWPATPSANFVMSVPEQEQTDPSISTE